MARSDLFDETVADIETETEENTVTDTQPEPAEEPTEDTATEASNPHLESVEAFKAALSAKQVEKDVAEIDDPENPGQRIPGPQGVLDPDEVNEIMSQYRAITGGIKYKNVAKKWVGSVIGEAIASHQFFKAITFNAINVQILAGTGGDEATVATDPNEDFAKLVAAYETAYEYTKANQPEDVTDYEQHLPDVEGLVGEVEAFLEWEEADKTDGKPDLSDAAELAVAILKGKKKAKAKTGGGGTRNVTYTGPRRDVKAHIEEAFANLESGAFMKVNDIAKFDSDEYGDDHPSSGAVTASLFPRNGKERDWENLRPGQNEQGVNGAFAV